MSRAAAIAYAYDDYVEEREERSQSAEFKVLGYGSEADAPHLLYTSRGSGDGRGLTRRQEEEYAPTYAQENREVASFFQSTLRWMVVNRKATALVAVAVVGALFVAALVRPVPAVRPSGGQALRLSGYSDMAVGVVGGELGASAVGAQPPVIDTTSAAQPEAPQPVAAPEQVAPPRPPLPTTGDYSVTAPPSTSVAQIERVLKEYGSPAVGHGQELYDLGVRYGIDPAYALAFFVHESGCGTQGVARSTKSLGNIRWTEGFDNYQGYRSYPDWASGMEDWYKLISNLYIGGWNLRTVDQIIPVYAPWGDNNHPPTYIASVKKLVDSWRGK